MPEIVISFNFSLDYAGQKSQEIADEVLQKMIANITSRGGTVGDVKRRIYSHQLIALGISEKDMFRLTAAGIITKDNLLGASEEELYKKRKVDYVLTFRVRRVLHERDLYLKGDSRQSYLNEAIAYLKDYNGQTYRRLRQKGVRTLQQLQQALLTRPRDADVMTALRFISHNKSNEL